MKKYKAYSLNNFREIPQLKSIKEDLKFEIEVAGNILPFKTNNYVVDELINWKNIPDDPIFILNFPLKDMILPDHFDEMSGLIDQRKDPKIIKETANRLRAALNPHPAGQMEYNVPELDGIKLQGLQHKYPQTLLFFPANGQTCHAYCTFCFRWPQFTGIDEWKFATRETEMLIKYLKEHKEITDILFTGGDPMVMSTRLIEGYIDPILKAEIPHLQTIRIGTKALSYWPYRFSTDKDAGDLLSLFERIISKGINLAIMAHFNHPVELSTEAVRQAMQLVRSTGAQIRSQSPILNHINDSPEIWAEMWRKQVNHNCIPYYMFIARDTGAQHYFGVPLVRAWEIFQKAYQKVSGVCRTVRGPSMSCSPGKLQVLGVSEVQCLSGNKKIFTLRFLQGRNPDWVARPFFAEYDENALWLDDLKPAFGEDKFFFEEELKQIYHGDVSDPSSEDF